MGLNRSIAFHTLGCKLNFAETSSIARQFRDAGYNKVLFEDRPDVFLVNTCSVTENADRECRLIVNRALTVNPDAVIVVTGCFAQLKPDFIASIPGVDLVLGASEKFNAVAFVEQITSKGETFVKSCDIETMEGFVSSWSAGDRTRVFLKVQDGCDYNCSFCTIPMARGSSRSNTIENVLRDVKEIVETGAREIVLTGINLGDFGISGNESGKHSENFFDLVSALEQHSAIDRIRISSIEPNLLEDRIIRQVASSGRFMPHFHIPLQSGSDTVLKRMRRRYLKNVYQSRVQLIKSLMPHACIGVDVIVGFPGETDEEFMETFNFLRDLDVSYFHVFTYSERDHTLASDMDNSVPVSVRKDRNRMLRILSVKKSRAFAESQLGLKQEVLFEHENKDGFMFGYTTNYIRIRHPYDSRLVNQIVSGIVSSLNDDGTASISTESVSYQNSNENSFSFLHKANIKETSASPE